MTQDFDFSFYIVTENDDWGKSTHGPYTLAEAENIIQIDEEIITREQFKAMYNQTTETFDEVLGQSHSKNRSPYPEKMLSEIKSWAVILLIIGIIQVFSAEFLSSTWGFLLICVGLSSFYFRSPAMFVVYGSTLSWAAISNALSGSGNWAIFSILQVFFAFQTFRQYFSYRAFNAPSQLSIENSFDNRFNFDKAAKPFPWISLSLGSISFVGLITVLLAVFIYVGMTNSMEIPPFLSFGEGIMIDFAVIGFATGLASLLTRYKYKVASIIGMISGVLVLLIEVAFYFME